MAKKSTRELCQQAIKLYLDTLYRKEDGTLDAKMAAQNARFSESYAKDLEEEGREGLRFGGRGSLHMKLRFDQGKFFISEGDARAEDFKEWEQEVGKAFEAAGLKFKYFAQ